MANIWLIWHKYGLILLHLCSMIHPLLFSAPVTRICMQTWDNTDYSFLFLQKSYDSWRFLEYWPCWDINKISMFMILDIVFIYEWTIINVIINDDNCAIIIYLMIASAYLGGRWKGRRKKGSQKWLMAKKSLTWKSILCGLSRNNLFEAVW